MTRGDRMVLALCGGLLGLFLWTMGYMTLASLILRADARGAVRRGPEAAARLREPTDLLPPYAWGAWPALAFAGYGTIVGAERMMDGFETIMGWIGKFAEAARRHG